MRNGGPGKGKDIRTRISGAEASPSRGPTSAAGGTGRGRARSRTEGSESQEVALVAAALEAHAVREAAGVEREEAWVGAQEEVEVQEAGQSRGRVQWRQRTHPRGLEKWSGEQSPCRKTREKFWHALHSGMQRKGGYR